MIFGAHVIVYSKDAEADRAVPFLIGAGDWALLAVNHLIRNRRLVAKAATPGVDDDVARGIDTERTIEG